MIFKIEALAFPYTVIASETTEGAALALGAFRGMLNFPEVQCVTLCFAALYHRFWPSDPRYGMTLCQYRYNEVPEISEWRVFRMWASAAFTQEYAFASTYNLTKTIKTAPGDIPLCAIRRVYGFRDW